ncbi:MAG: DUF1015 domain-containing protein [Flavobacteriaceae bacterium]|nr:DUF1015 domain-containing protein [Flavobacteriaceae bacterium]
MAKILPFKAVRPTRDKVSLVAARAYQTYTQAEREARLDYNPFSFLHIVNPGYKYQLELEGEERYALVKNRYLEFKEDAIFMQDDTPSYYVYKIVNREGNVFCGIVGAASTDDYETDLIKKHEDTIEYREEVFKEYLKTVGFNAEPVLLTYPDNPIINSIVEEVQKSRAEFEFTTTYRDTHYLWLVNAPEKIEAIASAFKTMDSIYIADGHHRSASSYRLTKDLRKDDSNFSDTKPYNFFMSYMIPESHLRIYEFNRLIKDLNGMSKEAFLIKLDTMYRIENRGSQLYRPSKKHHFSMYIDGEFYSLYLRKAKYAFKNALDALDTQILYKTILEPILGIHDMRNDQRLDYSHGKSDLVTIKSKVDSGEFKIGFGLVPITIDEMKSIANEGLTMPPKSTFIQPKLRSGVTIYEL